ncbi:MAG TPA: LytTR family DNA-binding domain-containing protein [Cyclobacteriaceae bacterium]|nr:LytTR family DNA-binding domain-containing protein [Cyclobacteriaceae bacterium]
MKVLILEDETLAAEKLESTLLEIQPDIQVVSRIKSISSAVEWLQSNPHPDLVISDIRLLDGLCFEIFSQVKVEKPVIFTTAYDQYAIRAFEVNSIDYLLKPVQKEKLQAALAKVQLPKEPPFPDYNEVLNFIKSNKTSYKSRFMVRLGQRIVAVPSEKIAYFYSENKLTYIVTLDNKKFPMDQPLDELIDLIDPMRFFRANRQFIVAFDSIAEIHPYFKGRIKIVLQPRSDEEVVISSERTPDFKKWIDQ